MITYKRICLKDYYIKDGNKSLCLEKGKEYITSDIYDNSVTVFKKYWANVPADLFNKGKLFTGKPVQLQKNNEVQKTKNNKQSVQCLCTTCVYRRIGCSFEYKEGCSSYAPEIRGDKF